jgi:hypothetical protein
MPFADRLDVQVDWLFYTVPFSNDGGIDTVFSDHFYDWKENWLPPGVGVVPGTITPYFGLIPPSTLGPIYGTPEQWLEGLDYDTWQAGGYAGTPCAQLGQPCGSCPSTYIPDTVTLTITDTGGGCSCYAGTYVLTYNGSGWVATADINCGSPWFITILWGCFDLEYILEIYCGYFEALQLIGSLVQVANKCWPFRWEGTMSTMGWGQCCTAVTDDIEVSITF